MTFLTPLSFRCNLLFIINSWYFYLFYKNHVYIEVIYSDNSAQVFKLRLNSSLFKFNTALEYIIKTKSIVHKIDQTFKKKIISSIII